MTLEHDAVRETLIEATLALMDQGGLEAVKARPLAQAVGVSVGTIYNLFGSVDGLVMAANMQVYADLGAIVRDRIAMRGQEETAHIAQDTPVAGAPDRVRERLLELAGLYIDFVAANSRRWAAVIAFDRQGSSTATPEGYETQLETLIGLVAAGLGDLPACHDTERAQTLARALWSSVYGIVSIAFFSGEHATARQRTWDQIVMLVTAVVAGLAASPSPS